MRRRKIQKIYDPWSSRLDFLKDRFGNKKGKRRLVFNSQWLSNDLLMRI